MPLGDCPPQMKPNPRPVLSTQASLLRGLGDHISGQHGGSPGGFRCSHALYGSGLGTDLLACQMGRPPTVMHCGVLEHSPLTPGFWWTREQSSKNAHSDVLRSSLTRCQHWGSCLGSGDVTAIAPQSPSAAPAADPSLHPHHTPQLCQRTRPCQKKKASFPAAQEPRRGLQKGVRVGLSAGWCPPHTQCPPQDGRAPSPGHGQASAVYSCVFSRSQGLRTHEQTELLAPRVRDHHPHHPAAGASASPSLETHGDSPLEPQLPASAPTPRFPSLLNCTAFPRRDVASRPLGFCSIVPSSFTRTGALLTPH